MLYVDWLKEKLQWYWTEDVQLNFNLQTNLGTLKTISVMHHVMWLPELVLALGIKYRVVHFCS